METKVSDPQLTFDQHDTVLALALGALSASRRFDAYVARASAPGSRPLGADDPLVLAALGAISLGRSLSRWLEEAAEPRRAAHVDVPTTPRPAPRELLR